MSKYGQYADGKPYPYHDDVQVGQSQAGVNEQPAEYWIARQAARRVAHAIVRWWLATQGGAPIPSDLYDILYNEAPD